MTSAVTVTDMPCWFFSQFLLHPLQPLSHPYPPGTLPDPPALDELTNQIMHYESLEHRSPRAKARANSARLRSLRNHASRSSASNAEESAEAVDVEDGDDEDMTSQGKRRWMHTWKQTRARLAHVGRLVSKGYNTEEISRALGHSQPDDANDEEVVTMSAVGPSKTSRPCEDIGPFQVGGVAGARKKPGRPHIRRVSSMDFLDAAATQEEDTQDSGTGAASASQIVAAEWPQMPEQGIGRVLRYEGVLLSRTFLPARSSARFQHRLSTTLQNSSKLRKSPPTMPSLTPAGALGSPIGFPASSSLLSPPKPTDTQEAGLVASSMAGGRAAAAAVNPRRSLRRRPSIKSNNGSLARPTSLLQRGRSFTASDLSKEVEEMKERLAASGSAACTQPDVNMTSVVESTGEQEEDGGMNTERSKFVTPVKKQHAADPFGPHRQDMAPPSSTSTSSDVASPYSSSPMERTPPQDSYSFTAPDQPVTSTTRSPATHSFRMSAGQRPKRAVSSILTSADFESTPHGLQQLFIAAVRPSTTDSSQLLAPFSLEESTKSSGRKSRPEHGDSPEIVITGGDESEKEDGLLEAPISRHKKARTTERDSARTRSHQAASMCFPGAPVGQAGTESSAGRLVSPFEETS